MVSTIALRIFEERPEKLYLNIKINILSASNMTKTLTIRDAVYSKLISVKGKDESFSELFERLVESRSPSEVLASLRGRIEMSVVAKRKMLSDIGRMREERRT